jgi:hypothetical protein
MQEPGGLAESQSQQLARTRDMTVIGMRKYGSGRPWSLRPPIEGTMPVPVPVPTAELTLSRYSGSVRFFVGE